MEGDGATQTTQALCADKNEALPASYRIAKVGTKGFCIFEYDLKRFLQKHVPSDAERWAIVCFFVYWCYRTQNGQRPRAIEIGPELYEKEGVSRSSGDRARITALKLGLIACIKAPFGRKPGTYVLCPKSQWGKTVQNGEHPNQKRKKSPQASQFAPQPGTLIGSNLRLHLSMREVSKDYRLGDFRDDSRSVIDGSPLVNSIGPAIDGARVRAESLARDWTLRAGEQDLPDTIAQAAKLILQVGFEVGEQAAEEILGRDGPIDFWPCWLEKAKLLAAAQQRNQLRSS